MHVATMPNVPDQFTQFASFQHTPRLVLLPKLSLVQNLAKVSAESYCLLALEGLGPSNP